MNIFKDVSILISRILVGVVLVAHGWQKYNSWTIEGTAKSFEDMGVPSASIAAQVATYFELAGGVLLILGLLVRIVGPLLFIQMAFAFGFAHWGKGIFIADGGWELVGILGAAGLALAAHGAGTYSLDYLFMTPFRARKARKEQEAKSTETAYSNQPFAPNNSSFNSAGAPAGNIFSNSTGNSFGTSGGQQTNNNLFSSDTGSTTNYGQWNSPTPTSATGTSSAHSNTGTSGNNGTSGATGGTSTGNAQPVKNSFESNSNGGNTNPADPEAPTTQWPGSK
ncbi:DoxX family membrane protein [Corynebacterium macclintockiae]|uniref:DoxX family protein n=1 Tax=Corynebacterium macclintockiae TaxID=2913501 RepID=UPI003EBBD9DC